MKKLLLIIGLLMNICAYADVESIPSGDMQIDAETTPQIEDSNTFYELCIGTDGINNFKCGIALPTDPNPIKLTTGIIPWNDNNDVSISFYYMNGKPINITWDNFDADGSCVGLPYENIMTFANTVIISTSHISGVEGYWGFSEYVGITPHGPNGPHSGIYMSIYNCQQTFTPISLF